MIEQSFKPPVGMPHPNSPPTCSADTELFKSIEPFTRLTVATRHQRGGAGFPPGTPCHAGEATLQGQKSFSTYRESRYIQLRHLNSMRPPGIYKVFLYPEGHLGFFPVTVLTVRPFLHLMVDLAFTGLIVKGNCWTPSRYRDISPLVLVVC